MRAILLAAMTGFTCSANIVTAQDKHPPFELRDGDRVVLIGGTLIEREQRYGYWEAALTARHPDKNITFRNLGWSGDTVRGEARARFGKPADGFKHLKEHVEALKPTVIIANYGFNESFAGPAGLSEFRKDLDKLLDMLQATKARVVLMGPMLQEEMPPPLPNPSENNKHIILYDLVMGQAANGRGISYMRFAEARKPIFGPLTENGIHLHDQGYILTASTLLKALTPDAFPLVELSGTGTRFDAVAKYLPIVAGCGFSAKGLPPGKYRLRVDGRDHAGPPREAEGPVGAEVWAGVRGPFNGPDCEQAEQLRRTIIEKNRVYFHRWRPQNETYLFGFRKHEQGNNAREIPLFDPVVEQLENRIAELRKPKSHTYELIRVGE